MRKNCKCTKCGLEFNQPLTRSKVGCSFLYNKYWGLIKCDKKGCKGAVSSILRNEIEDVQINLYSAQNKEYLNK